MSSKKNCGFLVLDRKGEYIQDTLDQRDNTVFGLQHHPHASKRMVVVSPRVEFADHKEAGLIHDYLKPQFNISDIEPIDLADFLPGLTAQQEGIIRDYAHIEDFYGKLLKETQFGAVDNTTWYHDFPGLYDKVSKKGKSLLRNFAAAAAATNRTELHPDELEQLTPELEGSIKPGVLERAAGHVKRFCNNPFFGRTARGPQILQSPSCVDTVLRHLEEGRFVFVDMRGQSDESYTMIAALFARRLLKLNKDRDDTGQIRACIVLEEAHNILSEDQLTKGIGSGSVFVELAREGRSFKLGFILVTQQPDATSIAPQVAKTIDVVVAFNMPPDDAKYLQRLKSGFGALEFEIANAPEFSGVAASGAGTIHFRSMPVDNNYMAYCAAGTLDRHLAAQSNTTPESRPRITEKLAQHSHQDRLSQLMQQRQTNIHPVALVAMQSWKDSPEDITEEEPKYTEETD